MARSMELLQLVTPPLVLNTCPCCDGSGRVVVRSSWFRGETYVCPSCKAVLKLTQKHSGTKKILAVHILVITFCVIKVVVKEATVSDICMNWTAYGLILYAVFRVPHHRPQFDLYRPWQFTLRSLTLAALDIAAIFCALIAGNPIPLAIASWVAVWLARRKDFSTEPLAN